MSRRCASPKCDYCGPLPSARHRDDRNAKPWRAGFDEYDADAMSDDPCRNGTCAECRDYPGVEVPA